MKNSKPPSAPFRPAPFLARWLIAGALPLWAALWLALPARAAQTDLSNAPITNTTSAQVKPNIMLLMDTSGSMGWGHMPDEVESITGKDSVGYKSAQCNVLYYNPATTYSLPKNADGTFFTQPSFTGARYDAYDSTSTTVVNLMTSFKAFDDYTLRFGDLDHPFVGAQTNDTPQQAYYYVFSGTAAQMAAVSYKTAPCTDPDTGVTKAATGGGTWTRVLVATGSSEAQNFANWYTYYRTRISLTKSAASLAFTPLTDSFRVGFITVNPKAGADNKDNKNAAEINQSRYLQIADFDTTQRGLWFSKLFSQKPGGTSPAREGLARVGRHYAGQHDGINAGMAGDPLQYSCQQNFTIMTTDGYWNDQGETPNGGPVQIDGVTKVGQQDGTLTPASGLSPRPIWEGFADGSQITTDNVNTFSDNSFCQGAYYYQSTSRVLRSTTQTTAATSQMTRSTSQILKSTTQNVANTVQNLQSTNQPVRWTYQTVLTTLQNLRSTQQTLQSTTQTTVSTQQWLQSTVQNLKSTSQMVKNTAQNVSTTTQHMQTVTQVRQSTLQNLQNTRQNLQSTSQNLQSTSQKLVTTTQNLKSTNQVLQSTTQITQSTSQPRQSTSQTLATTAQVLRSTTQTLKTTSQINARTVQLSQSTTQTTVSTLQLRKSTSQVRSCDASTERCSPVPAGSCSPGGLISCQTLTTGPALTAECTDEAASAANSYVATTCNRTATGPTGAASCTPVAASSANNYVATNCNPVTTGPTLVASCTDAAASSSNNYVATSCSSVATGPTPVASCTPATANSGNGFVTTSCSTTTVGPAGAATCSAATASSTNSYTATSCTPNNSSNVPVQTCAAATADSSNGYTTTSCSNNNASNVPVSSCTNSAASSTNAWTSTACSSATTTNVPVQTCTASGATSGNGWTSTTCNPLVTTNVGVQSCTNSGPSAPNWTTTSCGSNNTSNVGVQTCSAATGNAGNQWVTTTCPTPAVTTDVPSQTCTAAAASSSNQWTATSCRVVGVTNQPTQACTVSAASSGNQWVATSCPSPVTTTNVPVQSCTSATATSPNWVTVTCPAPAVTNNVPVATCTSSSATSPNWITTTCPSPVIATNVPTASCTVGAVTSPFITTTSCPTPAATNNVLVATCTAANAAVGNNWVKTTCTPSTVSGPTAVQTCTPSAATSGNNFQTTSCADAVNSVGVASCTPIPASSTNNWTETTCGTNNATNVPTQTCTPAGPLPGNQYTTTTCPGPIVVNNTPVATCGVIAASAANLWTATTCPAAVVTNNAPVQTCTAATASSTNNFVATSCTDSRTGPTGVSSCSNIAPTSSNNWITSTCGSANTTDVAVSTCSASGPTGTNQWVTTSCRPVTTTDVPVSSCTAATASSGNSWTRTDCRSITNIGGNDGPAQSCSSGMNASFVITSCTANNSYGPAETCPAYVAPSAGNGWTATYCSAITTSSVPVATCTPSTGTSGNGWVTTTCPAAVVETNKPVAACTAATANSGNAWTTTSCPAPITTSNVPSETCSSGAASSLNAWTATACSAAVTGPTGVQSCTPAAAAAPDWIATTCTPVVVAATGAQTCTPSTGNSGNGWVTTTCGTVNTGPTGAPSCTPSPATSANGWVKTECTNENTGPTLTTSCTPATASAANNWQTITCPVAEGSKITYTTRTTVTTTLLSGGVAVSGVAPTVAVSDSAPTDLNGVCYIPGVAPAKPALPNPNPISAWTDISPLPRVGPQPTGTCTAWPCTVTRANTGGSVNSLADVAQYYYATDLRPSPTWPDTIAKNDVSSVGSGPEDDRVKWQHMTTFSIALGVSGTLNYRPDYRSGSVTDGDFADIRAGRKNWPVWPDPNLNYDPSNGGDPQLWNNPKSIDDFWHTAVNGRGQYFSAGNPTSVIAGLNGALAGIVATTGVGSAAAVTTQQPVSGNNTAFLASYTTALWTGEVQALKIDINTGAVLPASSANPALWSAQGLLDSRIGAGCDSRKIYLMRAGATNNMVNFAWNSSVCDGSGHATGTPLDELNSTEKALFGSVNVSLLSQYPAMTDGTAGTVDQRTPATGANLVNFLRGQHDFEGFTAGDAGKLYRTRSHVLGDIVNGGPVYVEGPAMTYTDSGYYAFKSANAGRTPMLYVPANDGMLHAFYAGASPTDPDGGKEAWAMIPSTVLPNLYKLADNNYKNTHQYSVDGTPTVADAYDPSATAWKTILVAGLNLGGKGYYAIDVTDPAAPKAMWEFKHGTTCYDGSAGTAGGDCHLGYTYAKPLVTKLTDGRWVVIVTSGYNNVNPSAITGDGVGYLYVLNAFTGQIIYRIATSAGDATTPSGLGQLNNFVDDLSVSNTTQRVYGGDMLGNLWRFDINDNYGDSGREASLLATLKDPVGVRQPITVRPELAELNTKPMVLIGTGRLLGASDVTNLQVQSIYGIVDPMTGSAPSNLRSTLVPLTMTQTGSTDARTRTVACAGSTADCGATGGWVLDLPDSGERLNVSMRLTSGTLTFATNVPQNSACVSGGYSWFNYVDFSNGASVESPGSSISVYLSNSLVTGYNAIDVSGSRGGGGSGSGGSGGVDTTSMRGSIQFSNGDNRSVPIPVKRTPPPGKRVSWREISQ